MSPDWSTGKLVNEIITEMSLCDAVSMASMSGEDIEILQAIFDRYIGIKTGLASGDREYTKTIRALWKRLQKTHKLRVIKQEN